MERVTGIGGLFFVARDPGSLGRWYEEHLGVDRAPDSYDQTPWWQQAGPTVFTAMEPGSEHFRGGQWAVNFRVDDLDAMVQQLTRAGIQVDVDSATYPNGRFASLVDEEGNAVQLWQAAGADLRGPTATASAASAHHESRHVSVTIERSPDDVYDYAADPANLPVWASGLGSSIEHADGRWVAESPMGPVTVAFVAHNTLGVLDHEVTLASGETVYNPMRVVARGEGSEVVFTVRTYPAQSESDFVRDVAAVSADLKALKRILEKP